MTGKFAPGEIDQLRMVAIEYGVGSWSYNAETGCFLHTIKHGEQSTLTIEDMAKRVRAAVIVVKERVDVDYDWIEKVSKYESS